LFGLSVEEESLRSDVDDQDEYREHIIKMEDMKNCNQFAAVDDKGQRHNKGRRNIFIKGPQS
jgi:hypothetical protein